MRTICVCICGLNRSINLTISNFNKLLSNYKIEYILVLSKSKDKEYINNINQEIQNTQIIKKLILKGMITIILEILKIIYVIKLYIL